MANVRGTDSYTNHSRLPSIVLHPTWQITSICHLGIVSKESDTLLLGMGNSEALSYHLKIYLRRDETRLHLPTWRPSSPMSLPSNWQRNRQPCFLTWYTRQGTGKATRPMTSQAIMRLGERSWQWLPSPLSLRLRKLYLAWRAHPAIYKTGQGKMTVRHCCSIHSTNSGIEEGVARSMDPLGLKWSIWWWQLSMKILDYTVHHVSPTKSWTNVGKADFVQNNLSIWDTSRGSLTVKVGEAMSLYHLI